MVQILYSDLQVPVEARKYVPLHIVNFSKLEIKTFKTVHSS